MGQRVQKVRWREERMKKPFRATRLKKTPLGFMSGREQTLPLGASMKPIQIYMPSSRRGLGQSVLMTGVGSRVLRRPHDDCSGVIPCVISIPLVGWDLCLAPR